MKKFIFEHLEYFKEIFKRAYIYYNNKEHFIQNNITLYRLFSYAHLHNMMDIKIFLKYKDELLSISKDEEKTILNKLK